MRYYWYHKACTKHVPVLLCTTKLAQSKSQYDFVLHSLHKALPSTTLHNKACTQYFPVLLCTTKLAQRTSQYYLVLQSLHKARPSTALYYKARKKNILVTPCTTKLAQSTPQYSDYTAFCSITWLTRISVRTWSQSVTTIMQLLRCDLQPGIQHAHRTTRA